jgi:hypothetical protein
MRAQLRAGVGTAPASMKREHAQISLDGAAIEPRRLSWKVTPGMENFVKTVQKMIDEEMIPAIKQGHSDAKTTLRNFELGFRKCSTIRTWE